MSLKKKIALSFFISAAVIAVLAVFQYFNFDVIKNEIRFLELTDTVRSKSLQLRRHEKNYFLYSPAKAQDESEAIHRYLDELDSILAAPAPLGRNNGELPMLRKLVVSYRQGFDAIEQLLGVLIGGLRKLRHTQGAHSEFLPLIEAAFYERPGQAAEFLGLVFHLPRNDRLVSGLWTLEREIAGLRKSGEGIINVSKELDRSAREKVERGITLSQAAILVVFPIFLLTGVVMLFMISRNIVRRLSLLSDIVEKTGRGTFEHVSTPVRQWGADEVGTLIRKFDEMEGLLAERQTELEKKNQELVQVKKLAAIGTLAAGVAHELNNPLNNIYLSTQILNRELSEHASTEIREVTGDILGQTKRVKKIVSDLLEFARGREPRVQQVNLIALIKDAFELSGAGSESIVKFDLKADPGDVTIQGDPEQLEQVFINLFSNARQALNGPGKIDVLVTSDEEVVTVRVSDTGSGIPKESLEKVFEPFYSTKDKGTGLGLAIVFSILKKHFGEIRVESEVEKGSTFTITLPRSIFRKESSRENS